MIIAIAFFLGLLLVLPLLDGPGPLLRFEASRRDADTEPGTFRPVTVPRRGVL